MDIDQSKETTCHEGTVPQPLNKYFLFNQWDREIDDGVVQTVLITLESRVTRQLNTYS